MNLNIKFTHLESTPAITSRIEEKAKHLKKFFDGHFDVKWTCSADKQGQRSHVIVAGDSFVVNAESIKDDLYKTFDDVIGKIEKQLLKKKSQVKNKMHRKTSAKDLYPEENYAEEDV